MKITNIEAIPIHPAIAKRNQSQKQRFHGINTRMLFKIKTDNGVTGYGDCRYHEFPDPSFTKALIGKNPFDYINNTLDLSLGGALYDVMGKHLGVPAYKLMGTKVRDAVSVAAWTRPASPSEFREEISRSVKQGYKVFKMHTCTYHDVLE